jgi:hypothetical protein
MLRTASVVLAVALIGFCGTVSARYIQGDPVGIVPNPTPRAITASTVLSVHRLNHSYAYVSSSPLGSTDPSGLVDWRGVFGGGSYIEGGGGGVFGFQLTSECKCNQRVTITGFASALAVGFGIKAAAASGSSAEFYDYKDCPDPGIANGLFAMSSANFVFGTGPGYSKIQLGGLRSYNNLGDQNYGFDMSVGVYLGGSSVTGVKTECCSK